MRYVFQMVLRALFKLVADKFKFFGLFLDVDVVDVAFFSVVNCKKLVVDWDRSTDAQLGSLRL